MKMSVFAIIIVFMTFLILSVKFSRCGTELRAKIGTSEAVKYFGSNSRHGILCTLLHVTLKRRAEILGRIFLPVFCGCNITVILSSMLTLVRQHVMSGLIKQDVLLLLLSPINAHTGCFLKKGNRKLQMVVKTSTETSRFQRVQNT